MTEAPETPLAGVHVVEDATSLAATYAGFLLAELGAEVVRVEARDQPRLPGDLVLQRGKRSLDRAADATRRALLAGADVLLRDGGVAPPGDGVIDCSVTTWGTRPHPRALPDSEPLVHAATGVQALQWSWGQRPVWLVTPMAAYMTGMLGALGVTAALFAERRGAPAQRVEVSSVSGALALNSGTYVRGPGHRGYLAATGDPLGLYPTYGLYRTADGWLFVGALTQAFWVNLMTLLERVDLLVHPLLQVSPLAFGTPEIRTLVRTSIEPLFAARPTAEWTRLLRDADIPCGAVQSRTGFLHDPEAELLGLVADVDDPVLGRTRQAVAPAEFSDTPAPAPRAAPRPGADTDALATAGWRRAPAAGGPGPTSCLEGVRVLDLTSFIAGPFCPMLLADLGADVVKIESADGDPFRMTAFGFVGWNRGKRSLVLDLKRPEGATVLLDLARAADAVVDNFRAGVLDRLGLGWDRLHAANPRLVHTSITGFGSSGPLAALPGFDPVFQARSGLVAAQGGADEPVMHVIAYNDYCAGALGALATVAALVARERTGRGQRVDVSLFRTAYAAQAGEMVDYPGRPPLPVGGRDFAGSSAGARLYACRDRWLCVVASSPDERAALGRLAGTVLADDAPADGAAAQAVAAFLASLPRADALARLDAAGVPAAACLDFDELFTDDFLAARFFTTQDHPELGRLQMPGPFIRFSATPIVYQRSAPLLGAGGADVLAALGYAPERIARLVADGVVGRSPS